MTPAHRLLTLSGNKHDVMREQLEYLIDAAEAGTGDQATLNRYLRAADLLLEIFFTTKPPESVV